MSFSQEQINILNHHRRLWDSKNIEIFKSSIRSQVKNILNKYPDLNIYSFSIIPSETSSSYYHLYITLKDNARLCFPHGPYRIEDEVFLMERDIKGEQVLQLNREIAEFFRELNSLFVENSVSHIHRSNFILMLSEKME